MSPPKYWLELAVTSSEETIKHRIDLGPNFPDTNFDIHIGTDPTRTLITLQSEYIEPLHCTLYCSWGTWTIKPGESLGSGSYCVVFASESRPEEPGQGYQTPFKLGSTIGLGLRGMSEKGTRIRVQLVVEHHRDLGVL